MRLPPSLGYAGKGDDALAAGRPLLGIPGLGRASGQAHLVLALIYQA